MPLFSITMYYMRYIILGVMKWKMVVLYVMLIHCQTMQAMNEIQCPYNIVEHGEDLVKIQ